MNISGFDTVSGPDGSPPPADAAARRATGSAAPPQPPRPEPDAAVMREASRTIERILASRDLHLRFSVEEDAAGPDRIVIELVDESSGGVVRRIPPQTLVTIASSMEDLAGLVVDRRAV